MRFLLHTHYKHYEQRNNLQRFTELFCIQNALCKVEQGQLALFLPTYTPEPT